MKQIIQNLGIIIFVIGIALLVFGMFQQVTNNNILMTSGILILAGLFVHVIVNKKFM